MPKESLVQCYNKGCGQKFDPSKNTEDSCTFHPGPPYFHDAYKGWSCCNKRCTDFTEFLNVKGCTTSFHNNVKPPEPEKPIVDKSKADEVIVYEAPKAKSLPAIERPPYDTPLVTLKSEISPALQTQVCSKVRNLDQRDVDPSSGITIGTTCKNHGCKQIFEGPETLSTRCVFHPGQPIFHEGMKYWSCCTRRTTDFNSFLEQEGCMTGAHVWTKQEENNVKKVMCRHDWHQTPSWVVVSIFAKKYDPWKSRVELNPIRLKVHLFFPEEEKSFDFDIELKGVVNVSKSCVVMLPTKCEIKLCKEGPGSWSDLHFPIAEDLPEQQPETQAHEPILPVDDVDLSDL